MKIAASLLALTACATPQTAVPNAGDAPVTGEAECNAAAVQLLAGKPYSDAVGADVVRRTQSGAVRVIRPGQPVSMDYRTDRLNIEVDERNIILRAYCG